MVTTYTWENFKTTSPEYQDRILEEIEKTLPDLTWKDQAEVFRGAPAEVILKCLEKLDWRAQVFIYNNHLPAKAVKAAETVLSDEAAKKLKIQRVSIVEVRELLRKHGVSVE